MDLGEMIVKYSADTSGIISGGMLARESIAGVGAAAEESGSGFSTLGSNMSGIGSNLVNFAQNAASTIFSLQTLGQTAIGLASAFLQPAATAETTQLSFGTLLHSTSAAKQEMQDLNTYAAGTPMQTSWVDGAASKILAFGGKVGDVKPELTALGDSLSGLGKLSEASLNSMVDIFGKISAQGKITGGDMMQLSDNGIPAWQALSSSMGKPIPELQKMVSQGLIPASKAIPALEQGMEKVFGGGMAKQANTFTGLTSTLASNWQIAMAAIGGPALKEAEGGLTKIGTVLSSSSFQTFASGAGQQIGTAISTIATGLGDAISAGQGFANFLQQNQTAMDAFEAVIVGASVAIGVGLVSSFIAWSIAMVPVVIETLAIAAPYLLIGALVGLVVFGIIEAVQHWGAIAGWVKNVWNGIPGFFSGLLHNVVWFFQTFGLDILEIMLGPIGLIMHFWSPITSFFKGIIGDIGSAFSGLGSLVSNIWAGMMGGIKWAINGIIGLIDNFIGGIDSIGIDIGPVHIHPNIPEIPYLASGTNNFAGGWAVVGEKGPELVNLPGGSQVIPNGGSYPIKPSAGMIAASVAASGASAGGGNSGNNTYIFEVDGQQLARITQPHVDGLVRLKMGPRGRVA